ncbi:MAG: Fe-S oxidoreductase, partial [candidate division WWE3 bacterium GW2011_GWB1_44_4]
MKVVIGYPPIDTNKGTPLLSQNRQFQYFNSPTYIYPMVPAYAASLAKQNGYEVVWMDGIAEKKTYSMWLS